MTLEEKAPEHNVPRPGHPPLRNLEVMVLRLLLLSHTFTHYLSSNFHVSWPWGQRHSLTQECMKTNK